MAIPTTDGIKGAVVLGFQTMAAQFSKLFGVPADQITPAEILEDFDAWLNIQKAVVFQYALEKVQDQINQNVPVTAETVLRIENPYAQR